MNSIGWLSAHWKMVATMVPLLASGGWAGVNYIDSIEDRFSESKATDELILEEVRQTKCIVINHDLGVPVLECLREE